MSGIDQKIGNAVGNISELVTDHIELAKLKVVKKAVLSSNKILVVILLAILALFLVTALLIVGVIALANALGSAIYALLIVAGFIALVMLVIGLLAKKLFIKPLLKSFSNLLN